MSHSPEAVPPPTSLPPSLCAPASLPPTSPPPHPASPVPPIPNFPPCSQNPLTPPPPSEKAEESRRARTLIHLPDTPLFSLPHARQRASRRPPVAEESPCRYGRYGLLEDSLYPAANPHAIRAAESFLSDARRRGVGSRSPRYLPGGRTTGGVTLHGNALNLIERSPVTMMMWAPIVTGESRRMKDCTPPNSTVQHLLNRYGGGVETVPLPRPACSPYTTMSSTCTNRPMETVISNARRSLVSSE